MRSITYVIVESHDIERLRRSVAMLPPGHSAGALSRDAALEMIEELQRLDRLTARYRDLLGQLRSLLDEVEDSAR